MKTLNIGDKMKLTNQPNGSLSSTYNVTIGNVYTITDFNGCLIAITTDDGNRVTLNPCNFERV